MILESRVIIREPIRQTARPLIGSLQGKPLGL
jgi:hypothetical protein